MLRVGNYYGNKDITLIDEYDSMKHPDNIRTSNPAVR